MKVYQGDIKRKIILFIGFVSLILLALNLFPRFLSDEDLLILPEEYEYRVEIPALAILAKDEELYFAKTDGDIYKVAREGERVRVGQVVVDILQMEDTTSLKSELNKIENIIEFYEDIQPVGTDGEQASLNGLEILVSRLHNQMAEREYIGVHDTKEYISLQMESISDISQAENITLDSLYEKRATLRNQISRFDKKIYSNHSGLVSYKIDGWENYITPSTMGELSVEAFNEDFIPPDYTLENDNRPHFKIIDDYQWYMIMKFVDEIKNEYELNDMLEICLNSDNELIMTERFPIVDIVQEDGQNLYVLRGNKYIQKIFDKRKLDINVVSVKEDTFRIPVDSLLEQDGLEGVMIKEFYGVVTFRPVKVIARDERYAYLSKGDNNGYVELGKESLRTISLFSEIIKKPESVKVGDILK